ncbi:MAG: L,D-transpeptidase [Syntrophaceticus sp.]|nr:L,D-transpeptidase [Syntrophaceticus sp.]MDD3314475.1 L,D-transpeptidase [Syntrophaceticus sp.]MDD4359504.1 L,D-transpeptidase [Syntrophaceticus sp.]MDD4782587.1 L,D-transpeptidase [Syntrophaceticus sp.]
MLNKISLTLVFLIIGIAVLAGSGSFKPTTSSTIGEQNESSNQESSQTEETKPDRQNYNVSRYEPADPNSRSDSTEPNYSIEVSISEQKVRIFDNDTLVKDWIASTGENNSTPRGHFTIQNRGEWFFSEKYQDGAVWWVSFKEWGVYLFHSVPMDRQRNIIEEEVDKLGTPVSHGCVRLEVEDAKWIYDNIPEGTPVYID